MPDTNSLHEYTLWLTEELLNTRAVRDDNQAWAEKAESMLERCVCNHQAAGQIIGWVNVIELGDGSIVLAGATHQTRGYAETIGKMRNGYIATIPVRYAPPEKEGEVE